MIDVVVLILALCSLAGIVAIVVRKFPTLASVSTKDIPAERHEHLKSRLIKERFKRKFTGLSGIVIGRLKPYAASLNASLRRRFQKLVELEQHYRSRVSSNGRVSPEEREKIGDQLAPRIATASEALRRGELEQAEREAIEAIRIDPRNVEAYRIVAAVYIEQKNYEHARETLQFIINQLHVEDDELYAELGEVSFAEGRLEEARTELERSIDLNAKVAQHYLDLSKVHLALGDGMAAFTDACRAAELEPNNPKFLNQLVETAVIAGKREWAEETLTKLRQVNPDNQKLPELASRIEKMPKPKPHRSKRR